MPRSGDASDPGLGTHLRAVAADTLELARVRLELFTLETREAFLRLAALAALVVGGAIALSFGLSFLAVFIIVLLWDAHRLLALGIFAAAFLAGGWVLLLLARTYFRGLTDLFAATRGEWQRDRDRLLRTPPNPAQKGGTP